MQLKITPCLWFDDRAEEAARFYTSVFPGSRITRVLHYGEGAPRPAGAVLTVVFELDGQEMTALNGGPEFRFSPAVSMVVHCRTQQEVDEYWDKLLAGGGRPVQCGWLEDRFGLSWQVVPVPLFDMLADPDPARARRATQAMMQMVKLDLPALRRAHEGA